jgi:tetratricopeptide (TPR) repeat protein
MLARAAACLCLVGLTSGASAQIGIGGTRLPDGTQVTIERDRQEDPAAVREQMRLLCERWIATARKHVEKRKWYEALRALGNAKANAVERAHAEQIADLLGRIDAEGKRRLESADALYNQRKYADALEAYGRISRTFSSLPSGAEARRAVKDAEADPLVRAALAEQKAAKLDALVDRIIDGHFHALARREAKKAETRPTKVEKPPQEGAKRASQKRIEQAPEERTDRVKLLPAELQVRVVRLLERIARLYPGTAAGRKAAGELKRLLADPALAERLEAYRRSEAAHKLFQRAEAYRKARLLRKAIELYRQLIKKYPGSDEAKKAASAIGAARAEMKTLPRGGR